MAEPANGRQTMNAPEHLDEQARSKWAEVFPILESRGDVDQGALVALTAYASAWSQWLAAEAQVKTLGLVVKSPAGFAIENPYLTVARKAQGELRRWGTELRLTPKAKGKEAAGAEDPDALKAEIIAYIGRTTAEVAKELRKDLAERQGKPQLCRQLGAPNYAT